MSISEPSSLLRPPSGPGDFDGTGGFGGPGGPGRLGCPDDPGGPGGRLDPSPGPCPDGRYPPP